MRFERRLGLIGASESKAAIILPFRAAFDHRPNGVGLHGADRRDMTAAKSGHYDSHARGPSQTAAQLAEDTEDNRRHNSGTHIHAARHHFDSRRRHLRPAPARAAATARVLSMLLVWTLIFGALATLLAVSGPLSFVRRFLRTWGIWLLFAGAGWLTWNLLARQNLGELMARPGNGEMPFGAGIDLVVAMPLVAAADRRLHAFRTQRGRHVPRHAAGLRPRGGRRHRAVADPHRRNRQCVRRLPLRCRLDGHVLGARERADAIGRVRRAVHAARAGRRDGQVRTSCC